MKSFFFGFRTLLLVAAFIVLLCRPASAASTAFTDAFHAYVQIRQLEEEEHMLPLRAELDAEASQAEGSRLAGKLTEARIAFHSVLQFDPLELSPWELATLKRMDRPHPKKPAPSEANSLANLSESFPNARKFSPLEWQAFGEWFGISMQDTFLKQTFAISAAPAREPAAVKNTRLLWVDDPFSRLIPKNEIARWKAERSATLAQLQKQGYATEEITLSSFARINDQAEDLQLSLEKYMEAGPFLLLSSGHGSAVVMKTLDLHPAMLSKKEILGWLNLNGQLFGQTMESTFRKPAAETKADRQTAEARHELMLLSRERAEHRLPLPAKFPIVNLVSFGGKSRPAMNLRESLIPEGKSFFLSDGNSLRAIQALLGEGNGHTPD